MRALAPSVLPLSLLLGCASPAQRPAQEPTPTLYNAPARQDDAKAEDLEQLRASQIRYTAALGVAIRIGAAIFVTQRDKCPTVEEVVAARLVTAELRAEDAWGKPYRVVCPPGGPRVVSAGPDGVFDTPDDVTSGE
ncbi:MAG: hypothetical protein IT374_05565 [Polyangiaceae bacterium]|nr:hypothetical protein [Polyangiaceae bacterium]